MTRKYNLSEWHKFFSILSKIIQAISLLFITVIHSIFTNNFFFKKMLPIKILNGYSNIIGIYVFYFHFLTVKIMAKCIIIRFSISLIIYIQLSFRNMFGHFIELNCRNIYQYKLIYACSIIYGTNVRIEINDVFPETSNCSIHVELVFRLQSNSAKIM